LLSEGHIGFLSYSRLIGGGRRREEGGGGGRREEEEEEEEEERGRRLNFSLEYCFIIAYHSPLKHTVHS